MEDFFCDVKCVAFDLDGTIYAGNQIINGALELISEVKKKQWKIFYITNNSSLSRAQVYLKLKKFGLELEENDVINSAFAMSQYLVENQYHDIYCIGSAAFLEQIAEYGINVKSKDPAAIVVGYDPEYNLKKLEDVINIYKSHCKIIAANLERTYLNSNDILSPGVGVIVKSLEFALNREIDYFIGKPNRLMLDMLVAGYNYMPHEILVVGDTFDIDILMADSYGAKSIFINRYGEELMANNCVSVNNLFELIKMLRSK